MQTAAPALDVLTGAVVFTDIVGFTEYTALRGDAEALELLALQERIVTTALPQGARIVKELGDGLLLFFPTACDAIETTVALQERFEEQSAELAVPLWVRIGVHWGRPTRRRDDIVGHDVNVASRVVDMAGPGEVVVSEAACTALERRLDDIDLEELGPAVMKGIPAPIRLFRATRTW
ncbi:MAG: adenylate/guanylate cyclase domain-containing protein [Dehalococcoidia bacterium]|nr:adenylate/guanylate cyclase domain-containing protein [Dehalococcoidia bacterium]